MRLSSKFHQTSQYWIAVGIFIESRAEATTVARIKRINKYHQRKFALNAMLPRAHTAMICPFIRYIFAEHVTRI